MENPRKDEIKAVFLGYQASGKSTFLTAAMLASDLGKLKLDEPSNKGLILGEEPMPGKESYFRSEFAGRSRLEALRRGEAVAKTHQDEWTEIRLHLEIPGEPAFRCVTWDYAGELAVLAKDSSARAQRLLVERIQQTDCLYLFFDATLLDDQGPNAVRELGHQTSAIATARQLFNARQNQGWPIVVVITKAERLEVGMTSERINALNQDGSLGREIFKKHFGTNADAIIKSPAGKPAAICFVASLGLKPQSLSSGGFVINQSDTENNLRGWQPLGLATALQKGMLAARHRHRRRRQMEWLTNHRAAIATVASVLFILSLLAWRDSSALHTVEENALAYHAGTKTADEVLQEVARLRSWWHPFHAIRGQRTLLGVIPESASTRKLQALQREFTIAAVRDSLTALNQETEDLSVTLAAHSSFPDQENAILSLKDQWGNLLARVDKERNSFEDSSTQKELAQLQGKISKGSLAFLEVGLASLWRAASKAKVEHDLIREKSEKLLSEIDPVGEAARRAGFFDDLLSVQIKQVRMVHDKAVCDWIFEDYQNKKRSDSSNYLELSSLLEMMVMECRDRELLVKIRPELQQHINDWDYFEAKQLYKAYPKDAASVSTEAIQRIRNYQENSTRRALLAKQGVPYTGRYDREVGHFLRWLTGLNRNYSARSLEIEIRPRSGFEATRTYQREVKSGWGTEMKTFNEILPPRGQILLYAGGQEVASINYSGYQVSVPLRTFRWKPELDMIVKVTNLDNNQQETLTQSAPMSLLVAAKSGLANERISVRLIGLAIPTLDPSRLPPVRPRP